jgi:hypothetical protein
MSVARYVHWQDRGFGSAISRSFRDLYADLTSGEIAGIRRVAELTLA